MGTTATTREPGCVGSGAAVAGEPPAATPRLTNEGILSAIYQAKCDAARHALPKLLPEVWQYCERHVAAGLSWGHIYPLKLLELWDALVRYKPRTIVELGAGCTTAVFLHYAERYRHEIQYGCKLITVEENEDFYSKVKSNLPSYDKHEAVIAPVVFDGNTCRYRIRHDWMGPDLLYVDGPSNRLPNGDTAACLDAGLMVTEGNAPLVVMFDIRASSVRAFDKAWEECEHYYKDYHLEYGVHCDIEQPWYLSGIKHHTTARRLV